MKTRSPGGGRKPLPPEKRRKMVSLRLAPETAQIVTKRGTAFVENAILEADNREKKMIYKTKAKDLDELKMELNALSDDQIKDYDLSFLPEFGGAAPIDSGIFSWDADRFMIQGLYTNFILVNRETP